MKKFSTLLTALILSISLFAFSPQSMLSISNNTKYRVIVTIDNRRFTGENSNDVMLKDIDAGYHTIKISREKYNRNGSRNPFNNNQQTVYSGNVYVKPGFHVDITINRFGKAFIDERKIPSTWYDEEDENNNWNHHDHSGQAMNAKDFSQFKQTIYNESFESTKLAMARPTISKNYFTSAQVKEIVDLFSFENSKLDIAKSAYRNSIDKNNYFVVSDALSFSSSKEELAKFLESSK